MVASVLVCLLWLPGEASAKRLAAFDRDTGIGFVLDGRTLTTTITAGPQTAKTRQMLHGRIVRAACASSDRELRTVQRAAPWPAGTDHLAFTFDRDVSESAEWCLLEHAEQGADIAVVWFGRAPGFFTGAATYDNQATPRGLRRYLRIRDARGRVITTRRAPLLARRLRPGRYTLISFERRCSRGCRSLGPPQLRCARRFRIRADRWTAALVAVDREGRRCRISFESGP